MKVYAHHAAANQLYKYAYPLPDVVWSKMHTCNRRVVSVAIGEDVAPSDGTGAGATDGA